MWFFKKRKKKEPENFFNLYLSDDGENIDYKFETKDLDKFLQMMSLFLCGGINEEIIGCICKEINDKDIEEQFLLDIITKAELSLKEKGGSVVVSPSEFTV